MVFIFMSFLFPLVFSSFGVHLSFTGRDNELSVMFSQPEFEADAYAVKYGTSPYELNNVVNSTKYNLVIGSYTRDIYESVMTNLTSNSTYYYRIYCLNNQSKYEETTFFFDTFAEDNRGETTTPTEFISMADGVDSKFEEINLHLNRSGLIQSSKFMIYPGDFSFSYPDGDDKWDVAEESIMPFSGYSPVMYAPGNHDEDDDGSNWNGWENRVSQKAGINSFSNNNFWYSFKYRYFHIIQISSEHDYSVGSDQYIWLEEELNERVNRTETPFLLVQFHTNMYTSSTGHSSDTTLRGELEHFLRDFKVTAVFTGHVHGYERICEVFEEECISSGNHTNLTSGVVHLVVGTAGRPLHGWEDPKPDWSEIRFGAWGYLKCTAEILPDPRLYCQFFEVINISTTVIRDEFSIGYSSCLGKYPYEDLEGLCSDGHGSCMDDKCQCEENYYGYFCEITTCQMIFSNDSQQNLCSNHGNCSDFNECDCDENYFGEDCNVTICFDVFSNTSSNEICNSNGVCIEYNLCNCTNNSTEPDCGSNEDDNDDDDEDDDDNDDDDDDDDDENDDNDNDEEDDGDDGEEEEEELNWLNGLIAGSVSVSVLVILCCASMMIGFCLVSMCFVLIIISFVVVLCSDLILKKPKTEAKSLAE